jgi:hypothetical protein
LAHSCLCRVKNMLAGQWQPPKKSQVLLYLTDFLGGCPCPASIFLTLHKCLCLGGCHCSAIIFLTLHKCLWLASTIIQLFIFSECTVHHRLVRDSSAFRQLFFRLAGAEGRQRALHMENSGFTHATLPWHISTFRGYQILFSIRNPYINGFTNHFSIHS